jgi:hypothetical protein
MARENTKLDIPKEKQTSALFELLIMNLASIYCLHDSFDVYKCKEEGLEGKALFNKCNLLTNQRRQIIEDTKLDIVATLMSKYG